MYSFINDYSEGAHESILNALVESNLKQSAGYGLDEYCESAKDILKNVLKNNEIDIHFIPGGTQVNLISISSFIYVNTDESVHTARSSSACFPVFQCTLSAA